MKNFLLKSVFAVALVTVVSDPSLGHNTTSKSCTEIIGDYNNDVEAVQQNLQYMYSALTSKDDAKLKKAIGEIISNLKSGRDYSVLQGIKGSLESYKIPSHVDSWYKHALDQITSAGQREDEWKSKNTSGTTCHAQECKSHYNGCLLGRPCTNNLIIPACPTSKSGK